MESKVRPKYKLVIHGGAGPITREWMDKGLEAQYEAKLKEVLQRGRELLEAGESSLTAVEGAIRVMEDCALFDAGKGSVVNDKGEVEMDSSIMEGAEHKAGAVAGVQTIRHPISLARKVMEGTPHVMIAGQGADAFGLKCGLESVTKEHFFSEFRAWEHLETTHVSPVPSGRLLGTVGAVALDCNGTIAAGLSTGGTTKKMQGRIGDSPIIGAGTYADNETCGVACTGTGEYFIRGVIAHTVSTLYEYKKLSVQEAAEWALTNKVAKMGGSGGIIALDKLGNVAMAYNTRGMFRGHIGPDGTPHVFIDQT